MFYTPNDKKICIKLKLFGCKHNVIYVILCLLVTILSDETSTQSTHNAHVYQRIILNSP
jgi:hypothetical protein